MEPAYGQALGTTLTVTLATCTFLVPPGTLLRSASVTLAQTVKVPPGASMFAGLTLQE